MRASLHRASVLAGRITATALLAAAACRTVPSPEPAASLAIAGRVNQSPSVAAEGAFVAVSWVAVGEDGQADAFVATSHDGGAVFDAPIQVNDVAGEVRASEQQAPRIAVRSDAVAVLWTAKRGGETQIRVAVSRDGGRSFASSRLVSALGAPGTRGWGALLIDDRRQIQAVWLDTQLSASAAPSPHAGDRGGEHAVHAGASMPGMRQDVYTASIPLDEGAAASARVAATGVCFCCKTAITQSRGGLAAAWRDIYPGSLRDITYAQLDRASGLERVRVSDDAWKLDGCPEDGPAMAADAAGVTHVVWPTLVSNSPPAKGVFHAETADAAAFSPRMRLDSGTGSAAHPAIAVAPSGTVLAAWDVTDGEDRRLEMRVRRGTAWTAPQLLSRTSAASSPAIAAVPQGFLVAWGRRDASRSAIEIRRVPD